MIRNWFIRLNTPLLLSFATIAFTSLPAFANPLSEAEIRRSLLGHSWIGEYANGRQWAETFKSDGTTRYSEGNFSVEGKMRFESKEVCFTYGTGSGFVGGCFEVWRRSANCFDFYGVAGGSTNATSNQKRIGLGWTARAWKASAPSTCVSDMIS